MEIEVAVRTIVAHSRGKGTSERCGPSSVKIMCSFSGDTILNTVLGRTSYFGLCPRNSSYCFFHQS